MMTWQIRLGLGVFLGVMVGTLLADDPSSLTKANQRYAGDRDSLRFDAANTVFLAELRAEELRTQLRQAEDDLARTRRNLRTMLNQGRRGTVLKITRSEAQAEAGQEKAGGLPRAEAEALTDRLEAEVELAQLKHDVDKGLLQAAVAVFRDAELNHRVTQNEGQEGDEAEANLGKVRSKLEFIEREFLSRTIELNAKKRELNAARSRLVEAVSYCEP